VAGVTAMTEAEWLACADPRAMLKFLGAVSERKQRLLACACVRRVWHMLPNARSRKAVEIGERLADGLITAEKLKAVRGGVRWAANAASRSHDGTEGVKWLVAHLVEQDVRLVLGALWGAACLGGREGEEPAQYAL